MPKLVDGPRIHLQFRTVIRLGEDQKPLQLIRKLKSHSGDVLRPVRSAISDFRFAAQESSNIKILLAGVMDAPSMLLP